MITILRILTLFATAMIAFKAGKYADDADLTIAAVVTMSMLMIVLGAGLAAAIIPEHE